MSLCERVQIQACAVSRNYVVGGGRTAARYYPKREIDCIVKCGWNEER